MGFDIVVGPLEGIDRGYEESRPYFDQCLAMFEAVDRHLLALGLPAHVEPRPPVDGVLLANGRAVIEFTLALEGISDEIDERFDQAVMAGPGNLFLPVALPAPARLELPDGGTFRVGSAGALLMQCVYLLKLQNEESIHALGDALEQARGQGSEPLLDNPDDLNSELTELPLDGCDALCGAAAVALSQGASIYIY